MLLLVLHPFFEAPYGFAVCRKLNVGVNRVNFRTCRVAHERHANFLQDAGLHQARVERVAKIVKTDVAKFRVFKRGSPRAFYDPDRLALVVNDQPAVLTVLKQELEKPFGQRNLSGFAFGCFRARDEQQLTREVDVFPTLVSDLAAPHPGIECGDEHSVKVALGCRQQQLLLGHA